MSERRRGNRPKLLRLPSSRRRLRGDIDRELRFHIEGRIEELIAGGMTREQAERRWASGSVTWRPFAASWRRSTP